MRDVSVEIVQLVVESFQDISDLLNLRLVSKTFKSVVTPRAFHAISINESLESATATFSLQKCDESITSAVRRVSFRGKKSRRINEVIAQSSEAARRYALKTVFSGLSKFRYLQHLQLTFDGSYDIPTAESRGYSHLLCLQFDILEAISSHPPPSLTSVTISDMVPLPHDLYAKTDFHVLLRSLKSLSISVRYDFVSARDIASGVCTGFAVQLDKFWHGCMSQILSNSTSLTSLALYDGREGEELGWYAWMPASTRLTHLTALQLHDLVFPTPVVTSVNHEVHNVLGFILLHKQTLMHLVLNGCSILMDSDELSAPSVPLLWHVILRRLMDELVVLEDFEFTSAAEVNSNSADSAPRKAFKRDPRFLYQYKSHGKQEIKYHEEALPGEERDVGALEDLLAAVVVRRANRSA